MTLLEPGYPGYPCPNRTVQPEQPGTGSRHSSGPFRRRYETIIANVCDNRSEPLYGGVSVETAGRRVFFKDRSNLKNVVF